MKLLSSTAQIIVSSILILANVNSGRSSVIPLIALTDTNNAQSTIATFTLTESNLQFATVLERFTNVEFSIVCSSDGIAMGGLWSFPQIPLTNIFTIPPLILQTNLFPPILPRPPILIITNVSIIPPSPIYVPPAYNGGGVVVIGSPFQPLIGQTNLIIPYLSLITNPVFIGRSPTPIYVPPTDSSGAVIGTASASPIGFPAVRTASLLSQLTPTATVEEIPMGMELWSSMPAHIELTTEQDALFRDGFGIIRFSPRGSGPTTAFIRQVDSDNDGVPDALDHCLGTEPGSLVDHEGCSIEQLAPCDGPWRNHGEFVNVFKAVTSHFLRSGLITARQCRELNAAAAQADCGKSR